MTDFMRDHAGKFRFIRGKGNQRNGDEDRSRGQCKSVDIGHINDAERVMIGIAFQMVGTDNFHSQIQDIFLEFLILG